MVYVINDIDMSCSVAGAKDLLSCHVTALTWAGMSSMAHKSCTIVIIKGRSMNSTAFSTKNLSTPTNHSKFILSVIPNLSNFWVVFLMVLEVAGKASPS